MNGQKYPKPAGRWNRSLGWFLSTMKCIKQWSITLIRCNLKFGRSALYKQFHTHRETNPSRSQFQCRLLQYSIILPTSSRRENPGSPNVDKTMGMNKGMEILNQVQNDPGWYLNPLHSFRLRVQKMSAVKSVGKNELSR